MSLEGSGITTIRTPHNFSGALSRIRTDHLRITSALLYQMSYEGKTGPCDTIRTCDHLVPNQELYQAELHTEKLTKYLV